MCLTLVSEFTPFKMPLSVDLLLGIFLITCGFLISLFNLKKIIKNKEKDIPKLLLSENIILICIGIAFVSKSVYKLHPSNIEIVNDNWRNFENELQINDEYFHCNFSSLLMTYGPLIMSFVNSFVNLMINNYVKYKELMDSKRNDENMVQDISRDYQGHSIPASKWIRNIYPYGIIIGQWLLPMIFTFSLFFIGVQEKTVISSRSFNHFEQCTTMLDMKNESCVENNINYTQEIRNYVPINYLHLFENPKYNNSNISREMDSIVNNVYKIIDNFKDKDFLNNSVDRENKLLKYDCMKLCYLDTKWLIVYTFLLIVITFLIPVTISMVILTKIEASGASNVRDTLYSILFWTPVMFDMILSLIFCSYSMNGTRASLLTVLANIYQVIKNIINSNSLKHNSVTPV